MTPAQSVRRSHRWGQHLLIISASIISLGLPGCAPKYPLKAQVQASEVPTTGQPASLETDAIADVQALVALGPRVAGTPTVEAASTYLLEAYHQAGYVTSVQTFTYTKFRDQGSSLTIDGTPRAGRALRDSPAATVRGRLVAVPGVGHQRDFAAVDVRGAIAVVNRGEIRFLKKVNNAIAAGAIGLVIVNTNTDPFWGTLGETVDIPVLSLSGAAGHPLLKSLQRTPLTATLTVNAGEQTVTGRNIIAHRAGVTQPRVLIGGHYDSVVGSPGANDNASGTAAVLAIARQLSDT
ncbi:MAG: M28 family peptidase, partial [Cyanothece sp. SIO1E1]|nr:M28 family peptidase [Cyanothece sp. SIO1E1]